MLNTSAALPNCHWHQLLRKEATECLGSYCLFWQLKPSKKEEGKKKKIKGIIRPHGTILGSDSPADITSL